MIGNSVFLILVKEEELATIHFYSTVSILTAHPAFIKTVAWFGLLFFGVGFFIFLSGRYLKKPCLILDSEGLYIGVNYIGGFRGKLSWDEIIEISVYEIMQQSMIRIYFIPNQNNSKFKRKYSIIQKVKKGLKTAYLPLVTIKEDEQTIMEQLHRFKEKYKPKSE